MNLQNSIDAIVMLAQKGAGRTAIKNGVKTLSDNVKTTEKGATKGVDPHKIQQAFKGSKFNAQIAAIYPKEHAKIEAMKKKMKEHHLDLSNLIMDAELVASSTKTNVARTQKILTLRDRYKKKNMLTMEREEKNLEH